MAAAGRPGLWSELALRFALAILPCTVLAVYLRPVIGEGPVSWAVPLAMAFANAWMAVSVAREALGKRGFLLFWAVYGLVWTAVAWHGVHFHGPPRLTALVMNLGEVSHTPLPDRAEIPLGVVGAVLGLGWFARRASPADPRLRRATFTAVLLFLAVHAAALARYRTVDMLRFSQYTDLVRTQGLEGAAALDALELLRKPDTAGILRELRRQAEAHPFAPLPLDPVAADRMVIVQVESLDREAIGPEAAPNLERLRDGATQGFANALRTSVSGSSSADFQLLTGLVPEDLVPAYRLTWDGDGSGLPAYAASRRFAFHVYHGNDRQFWNRGPFLDAMGANFHALEEIPRSEYSRWGLADGDVFRYAAARVRTAGRAIHFVITLSTHAPFDMVEPAAHLEGAAQRTKYLQSIAYVDRVLGEFLAALPKQGVTLVAIYSDHTSGAFATGGSDAEPAVPMILGRLGPEGSLAQLTWQGRPVHALPGTYGFPALHRYIMDCLDASAH